MRQCCAQYRDRKQTDRREWQRDRLRCQNRATVTIYGAMPQDDSAYPWLAFVCKRHTESSDLAWIKVSSSEGLTNLLTPSELEEYLSLFLNFDSQALTNIRAWRESRRARSVQREELIRQIAQSAKEVGRGSDNEHGEA